MNIDDLFLFGSTATSTANIAESATRESILEAMQKIHKAMAIPAEHLKQSWLGEIPINVIESPLCERMVPIHIHIKRGTQAESYHLRIQKKWIKRFGRKPENVAYIFNDKNFGLGSGMILSPRHMAALRNFAAHITRQKHD